MSMQSSTPRYAAEHGTKSLREGAVCFACALVALFGAALAIQWVIDLLT